MHRSDFSAETAPVFFDIPKPLPERKRPVCESCGSQLPYEPDPPLGPPYPGYSMMAQVRAEHEELRRRGGTTYREPDPPAVRPTPQSSKKKKKGKK